MSVLNYIFGKKIQYYTFQENKISFKFTTDEELIIKTLGENTFEKDIFEGVRIINMITSQGNGLYMFVVEMINKPINKLYLKTQNGVEFIVNNISIDIGCNLQIKNDKTPIKNSLIESYNMCDNGIIINTSNGDYKIFYESGCCCVNDEIEFRFDLNEIIGKYLVGFNFITDNLVNCNEEDGEIKEYMLVCRDGYERYYNYQIIFHNIHNGYYSSFLYYEKI